MAKTLECATGVLVVPIKFMNKPETFATWVKLKSQQLAHGKKGVPSGGLGGQLLYKVNLCGAIQTILAKQGELADEIETRLTQMPMTSVQKRAKASV